MPERQVKIEVQFHAKLPDGTLAADDLADEIGDAVIATLREHFPESLREAVPPESFKLLDWSDEPEQVIYS